MSESAFASASPAWLRSGDLLTPVVSYGGQPICWDARMEASGAPRDDRALVELRVLVAEVARRAQAIREAERG